jgi:hypothetical protein
LDSFTAITVMEALKRLTSSAVHRTTIVCAIHQPRADIFNMFDSLLLLGKGGHVVYCGATASLNSYFEALQLACPVNSNPADYYMDISSVDPAEEEEGREPHCASTSPSVSPSRARVRFLVQAFQKHCLSAKSSAQSEKGECMEVSVDKGDYASTWTDQVKTLSQRALMNTLRDPWNFVGGMIQALLLSVVITAIFWQLPESFAAIESRCGLLYITTTLLPYILMISLVERYCSDLKIFDREQQDDMYSPSAYFVASVVAGLPQLVLQPVLYCFPPYFGCTLRPGAQHFLTFVCVNIALACTTSGLAWCCASLQRPLAVASLIANMNFTFICLTAGYLVNLTTLPVYINWVQFISFLNYSYQIVMNNEFANQVLGGCPYNDDASCQSYDGNYILSSRGIGVDNYSTTWPVLFSICLIYHIFACLVLSNVKFPLNGTIFIYFQR